MIRPRIVPPLMGQEGMIDERYDTRLYINAI